MEKHPKETPRRSKPHKHDLRVKRSCHKMLDFLVLRSRFCSEWIQDAGYPTCLRSSLASSFAFVENSQLQSGYTPDPEPAITYVSTTLMPDLCLRLKRV
jgi:hypothetical protein